MQKKQLLSYFDTQCGIISRNLKKICKDADEKALHDLRVAFKKIKAMVWLMDKCEQEDAMKNYVKEIYILFKEAGAIRNAQLCMQFAEENNSINKRLSIQQTQIIQTGIATLAANQKLYQEQIQILCARLKNKAKRISFSKALHIVTKRRKKIMHFLQTDISKKPELLHNCRKQIKSVYYIHQAFLKFDQKKLLKHTGSWNKLQEAIGNWHDVKCIQQEMRYSKASKAVLNAMALKLSEKRLALLQTATLLANKQT